MYLYNGENGRSPARSVLEAFQKYPQSFNFWIGLSGEHSFKWPIAVKKSQNPVIYQLKIEVFDSTR